MLANVHDIAIVVQGMSVIGKQKLFNALQGLRAKNLTNEVETKEGENDCYKTTTVYHLSGDDRPQVVKGH